MNPIYNNCSSDYNIFDTPYKKNINNNNKLNIILMVLLIIYLN